MAKVCVDQARISAIIGLANGTFPRGRGGPWTAARLYANCPHKLEGARIPTP